MTNGLDAHTIDVSTDGKSVAYSRYRLQRNIWALPIPQNGPVSLSAARQITTENQIIESIDLSPDGNWLVYDSNLEGNQDIFRRPLVGGEPLRLTTNLADDFAPAWSADGSEIVFHSVRTGNRDVFVIPAEGGEAVQLTDDPAQDMDVAWSPDGLKISFSSDRSGRVAPHYISRDSIGGEWREALRLTSDDMTLAGISGAWSPDGRFFAYPHANGVRIVSPNGSPRTILSFASSAITVGAPYAWSSDGSVVYIVGSAEDSRQGVWSVPIATGAPALLVIDDDPRTSIFEVARHGNVFYLSLTEEESDIFTMDLSF